ncbi:C4-dicarboxylate ABC transporter substrate-binding protein [Rhodococcus gannanensis]|uniref:C4-dicarboxylate ABC transporter substrate-binding protein n=1 Tax=Rhodococcus gannanensis TaxID=1960308 RepID=A0ABW4PBL7_9NOCA
MTRVRIRAIGAGMVACLAAVAVAGCAESASAGNGGGSGLEYGASKEGYVAAFEDVEPIVLHTQSPSSKGSTTGRPVEAYLESITEWSGGKITFDIAYANAIAAPADIDDALLDGRLDLAHIIPQYDPSEYPASAALTESAYLAKQTPVVGVLQSNAWANDVAFGTPEIVAEYENRGMKLLLPEYNSGSNGLFCATPRNDLPSLHGAQVTASGRSISAEVTALGASPVTMPYTELYEALQRKVADCAVTTFTVGTIGGFLGAAPHAVIDSSASFANGWGGIAMSQQAWDSLPLVAQQLIWDRVTVFMKSNVEDKVFANTVAGSKEILAAGGGVGTFAPDAAAAINAEQDKLLDGVRTGKTFDDGDAFVSRMQDSAAEWLSTLEALGYTDEVDYDGFAEWYAPGKVDLTDYTEKVYEQIFLPHRPS